MWSNNMVTLITEKLQNQSLEDVVNYKDYELFPYMRTRSSRHAKTHIVSPVKKSELKSTKGGERGSGGKGSKSSRQQQPPPPLTPAELEAANNNCYDDDDLEVTATVASDPPKKRHCRSLSVGELKEGTTPPDAATAASCWKPQRSSVWKMVVPNGGEGSRASPGLQFSTPPESPVPRPASANTLDHNLTAPWLENSPARHARVAKTRSLSLSEGKMSESSGSFTSLAAASLESTPELPRKAGAALAGLHRCHSQPCELDRKMERKGRRLKRRRNESCPSSRPSLKLEKMEETSYGRYPKALQFQSSSKSCRSLAPYFDQNLRPILQPIASSPCDSSFPSSVLITPTASPTSQLEAATPEEDSAPAGGSGGQEEIFQLDPEYELDLDEIEKH